MGRGEWGARRGGRQRALEPARLASLFIELADTVLPLEEPQPAVYRLLKHTLERLAVGAGAPGAIRLHFIVRLLRLAGFQPQLDRCTGCSAAVHAVGYWSARQGGLLCPNCLHEDPQAEPAGPAALETLEALCEADQPLALEPGLIQALKSRLDEFLRWRLDKPLKTLTT